LAFWLSKHKLTAGQLLCGAGMQPMQRARSETAKLAREDSILTAAEILLRQSGYDAMTMQAVATAAGLAKGTLYLYFTSRESLVLAVYGRLFDRWIDRFAAHQPELTVLTDFAEISRGIMLMILCSCNWPDLPMHCLNRSLTARLISKANVVWRGGSNGLQD
jgi:AcrR family transcriptional regulator